MVRIEIFCAKLLEKSETYKYHKNKSEKLQKFLTFFNPIQARGRREGGGG